MPKGVPLSEETKKKISDSNKKTSHVGRFKKGFTPWNKGKAWPDEMKKRISDTCKRKGIKPTVHFSAENEKHPFWKGKNASYSAHHHWVKRKLGKPNHCEHCGKTEGRFEWANKSREYKRDLKDYMPLCYSCHDEYDQARKTMWETRRNNNLMIE